MNLHVEKAAFVAVVSHELALGRNVSRAPRGSGYDLTSIGPDGKRHIEVKSTKKPRLTERWLEPLEFERLETDPLFFVYAVVDCAGTPRVVEFDRDALMQRYAGPITKYALRFTRSDFLA